MLRRQLRRRSLLQLRIFDELQRQSSMRNYFRRDTTAGSNKSSGFSLLEMAVVIVFVGACLPPPPPLPATCAVGSLSGLVDNGTTSTWSCSGSGGGTNATCTMID